MHRVDQHGGAIAADLVNQVQRGLERIDGEDRAELHGELHAARDGLLGEQRQAVAAARDIGVHADAVDPDRAELGIVLPKGFD